MKVYVPFDIDDHNHDADHDLVMKVLEDENSLLESRRSDNGHDDHHSLAITQDHGRTIINSQAVIVFDFQCWAYNGQHDYDGGLD